jgi:hypothetical protein
MSPKLGAAAVAPKDVLLRSINIAFDADYPERIAHFRPTSKSVPVLQALLGQHAQRAFLVTAPYGSGKSLVGGYALQVIENNASSRNAIKKVTDRLASVSKPTASLINARSKRRKARGLAIAIQGAQVDLSTALAAGANASLRRARRGKGAGRPRVVRAQGGPLETLLSAMDVAAAESFDSVLLVWDEFGRHLETLLSDGRAGELIHLQTMAEIAARQTKIPLTIALLTHRGIHQYSSSAPQAIKTEWAKVEGRFECIQYVDDSKEMYRLIAESVRDRRPSSPTASERKWLHSVVTTARPLGVFKELSLSAAKELVESAYPLHPFALYALPRVAARVSQNERTIFSFLAQGSFRQIVGLDSVYDYFSDSMRADTGAGGAHRQYLETETAIRRASSDAEVETLKAACLLALGLAGERGRVSKDVLCTAIARPSDRADTQSTVKKLIEKKLLLHRQHGGEVSVWHGTDVDLRGALEDRKDRGRVGFNVLDFIRKELPAPTWRPVQFNDDFHIKRFMIGRYLSATQFEAAIDQPGTSSLAFEGADGCILFVLAETTGDQQRASGLAQSKPFDRGIVIAVPQKEVPLGEAALDVACLEQMLRDPDLIGKDPLVEVELKHLLDDARGYLHRSVDQLFMPQPGGPVFWHRGKAHQPSAPADLRSWLSQVIGEIYERTPKINNEMVNRRRVSAPVANARKKLEMAILERTGLEGLGIEGNFPDASVFRTVLLNTGLYVKDSSGSWRFADPSELSDPGLHVVWEQFRRFFQESSPGGGKPFRSLFASLQGAPIGLRAGVIPILVAAAFRAFPAAISLRRNGAYVDDILPSIIEDICRHPDEFSLDVLEPSARETEIIRGVRNVFSDHDPGITAQRDVVRAAFDSLRAWVNSLPPVALRTEQIAKQTASFRAHVTSQSDPVQLLFRELVDLLAGTESSRIEEQLRGFRNELEAVVLAMRVQGAEAVRRTLDVGLDRREGSLIDACQKWTKCFSLPELEEAGGAQALAFINRIRQRYDSDDLFLDSLSSQLLGQPVARWDDGSLPKFDRAVSEAVRAVEEEAVRLAIRGPANPVIVNNVSRLIEARLRGLYENLGMLAGEAKATEVVLRLASKAKGNSNDGNDSRSA